SLTITGFDAQSGTFQYSYTETGGAASHNAADDNVVDSFAIVVTDNEGDTASDSLDIQILDTAPTAVDDSIGVQSGQTLTVAADEGLLANDSEGADGATVTSVDASGIQGTFTWNADGSYSYTADPNATYSDTLTYTITDADGDTSTATLTLNVVEGVPTAPTAQLQVLESALAEGSNPDSTEEVVNGQLNATDPDGDALTYTAGTYQGEYGTLDVRADGSFTYTLTKPVDSPDANNGGHSVTDAENFTYTVTDANGNVATGSVTVKIIDDVPQAQHDSASLESGATLSVDAATGLLANDITGADGATVTAVDSSGLQGTLTWHADGSYTYTAKANASYEESLTYTITDGDGDVSQATLKFVVTDGSPSAETATASVSEAGLASGSDAATDSEVTTGQLAATDASGGELTYSAGTFHGTFGTLVVSADGSFTYTLTSAVAGGQANDGNNTVNGAEVFDYTVTDANGNTATAQLNIDIVDDVPTAVDDATETAEDTAVTYDVLANDEVGADGASLTSATLRDSSQGSVTVNVATGEVTFTPAPGFEGAAVIDYTITDGDGDTSSATLTVEVAADSTPTVTHQSVVVDEDGLDGGIAGGPGDASGEATVVTGQLGYSFGNDGAGSFSWSSAGLPTLTASGEAVNYSVSADGLTLIGSDSTGAPVITVALTDVATGAYKVTLSQALDHGTAGTEDDISLEVGYTIIDGDGSEAQGSLTVNVDDDSPDGFVADDSVLEQGATGSLNFGDASGADGVEDVSFRGLDGQGAVDVTGSPLYFDGQALTYRQTSDGKVLEAVTEGGEVAFTVTLDPAHDSFRVEVSDQGEITNGRSGTSDVSEGTQGAKLQYFAVNTGDADAGNDVLYSTPNGFAINALDGSIGVLDSDIDTNELLRIDFMNSLSFSTLGDPSWAGHESVGLVSQTINVAGVDAAASLTVRAVNYADNATGSGSPSHTANTYVSLSAADVRVLDGNGVDVTNRVTITETSEGGLSLVGVKDGWTFELSSDESFAGVEILGGVGAPFTLGDMDYRLGDSNQEFDVQLGLTGTDGDGDTAEGSLSLNLGAPGQLYVCDNTGSSVTGSDGSDVIVGDAGGKFTVINPAQNYNVSLILDSSGSMSYASGTGNLSRMALAKQALVNLVNQLSEFDGVINLQVVDFDTGARYTAALDLGSSASEVDRIIDYINGVDGSYYTGGGTNYEAAFEASREWLQEQSTNQYENLTFFLTDGDPTYYLDDNNVVRGSGSSTGFNEVNNAIEAFEGLSDISRVEAIGIGSGINEDVLKFFDNTDVVDDSAAIPYSSGTQSGSSTLADFTGSDHTLDSRLAWTRSGDSKGILDISGGTLTLTDRSSSDGRAVATSDAFTLDVPDDGYSTIEFRYQTDAYGTSDNFRWDVQQDDGKGGWTSIRSGTVDNSQTSWSTIETGALQSGTYRLVFDVINGGGQQDLVEIDSITVNDYVYPTAPTGQATIVNTAEDLEAALQGGSSFDKLAALGDDVLEGTGRGDLIFGDTVNSDALAWTNGKGQTFEAGEHDGLGFGGLFEYLKWSVNGGEDPGETQVLEYIRDNQESLIDTERQDGGTDRIDGGAGDDTLIAGGGNDILIGGEGSDTMLGGFGADTFIWNLNDEGTVNAPAQDVVKDFHLGEYGVDLEADKLSLGDLLQGYDPGSDTDQQALDGFIHAEQEGADTVLYIKSDGGLDGDNTNADQKITLENVSMGSDQSHDFIGQMISQGQLDVE
ncbi:Ig-like domain-containing protein, partial [Halomonas sp. V046]|uniref:Ig-like domain-containing protein n=1 Tax=Halomonas sp. V046 TaxID=3459611 RepID=UPI0040445356